MKDSKMKNAGSSILYFKSYSKLAFDHKLYAFKIAFLVPCTTLERNIN